MKAYCEGYLGPDGDFCLKLSGICEDRQVAIQDEDLKNDLLIGLVKVIFAKAVIPLDTPLKMIKSFADFCRLCIYPFMFFINEN